MNNMRLGLIEALKISSEPRAWSTQYLQAASRVLHGVSPSVITANALNDIGAELFKRTRTA